MFRSLQHNHLRLTVGLLLFTALALNIGFQYSSADMSEPLLIDLCDHSDSEKECENTEKGEADEFVELENNTIAADGLYSASRTARAYNHYHLHHLENPTPPPETCSSSI